MADRKKLQEELNRINQLYQDYDLDMRKAGGTMEQRQQMRDLLNAKKTQLMTELGDDLQNLNMGGSKTIAGAKKAVPGGKMALKKLAGIIPFMGVGAAALSGDPAMAAEELATDAAGPAGALYEAIKPDIAGDVEAEKLMLAERNAQRDYDKSPAARDAAKASGKPFPKIRQAIGRDRFQALTGTDLRQADANAIRNEVADQGDEEELRKLQQKIQLSSLK